MQAAQKIDTAESTPPAIAIGAPFEGGYFGGSIVIDGKTYGLIVAPKADGQKMLAWKNDWSVTAGTLSLNDGFANSEAMNNDDHPAAHFCRALRIGGFDDWYLPSRDELEVLYRNLKPTSSENYAYPNRAKRWGVKPGKYNGLDENGNGHNASSAPTGEPYTEQVPAQTSAEAFQEGGAEAFDDRWYWSGTEFHSGGAWDQYFVDGSQVGGLKDSDYRCRAVRKFLI